MRSGASELAGADPRALGVHRAAPKRDVPYVPTDEAVVSAMLWFAHVTGEDVVYDLGCGDGRIVIAAAKQCGARGVGVDIDPLRVQESREKAVRARVGDRVRFLCQSFFETDLREATVVMLYLLPGINARLRPKLLAELRTGARIIANHFDMGDWAADMQANVHHRMLYQWIVPAWVEGKWRCVVNWPEGRRRMILRLRRRYQQVMGTAKIDGQEIALSNGRLFGEQLTFKVYDPGMRRPVKRFAGTVEGSMLRGVCRLGYAHEAIAWGGVREAGEGG